MREAGSSGLVCAVTRMRAFTQLTAAERGFAADEWHNHHQGGPTGYTTSWRS